MNILFVLGYSSSLVSFHSCSGQPSGIQFISWLHAEFARILDLVENDGEWNVSFSFLWWLAGISDLSYWLAQAEHLLDEGVPYVLQI